MRYLAYFFFLTLFSHVGFFQISCAATAELSLTEVTHDGAMLTVASDIDGLRSFLREHADSVFSEETFDTFSAPFKDDFKRRRRIEQMRAKNAAFETISKMVLTIYYATSMAIDPKKITLPEPFYGEAAACRSDFRQYYQQHIHSFFLRFQLMLNDLLIHAKEFDECANSMLCTSFGASKEKEIAWLHDPNGLVPLPWIHQFQRESLYHAPTHYGGWPDGKQRSMIFIDGVLVTSPGILVQSSNKVVFKFIFENGAENGFLTAPTSVRTLSHNPAVVTLLRNHAFKEGGGSSVCQAFLPVPSTEAEEREFEAAFLEYVLEEAADQEGNPFSVAFLEAYTPSLSLESGAADPEDSCAAEAFGADKIREYVDSLYIEHLEAEASRVVPAPAESSKKKRSVGRKDKKKKTKKKTFVDTQQSKPKPEGKADDASSDVKSLEAVALSRLKTHGREKWRNLVGVISAVLNDAFIERKVTIHTSVRGSHFNVHIAAPGGSAGMTIVRPHGSKERSIAAGEARGLARKLIDLTLSLI